MLNSYAPRAEIAALFASREANRPAEVHADAEGVEHGGLYGERLRGARLVGSVGDVDVIGAMARHEGIARDAIEGGADQRPLQGGLLPPTFCLFGRKRDHRAQPDIHMLAAGFDEDAAPDDLSRTADALQRSSTERKVHWGLPFARSAAIAIDEVAGGCGAGDLQHPHELVDAASTVVFAPAQIVQRGRGIEPQRCPATVRHQRIQPGALVYLVEMRQRTAGV